MKVLIVDGDWRFAQQATSYLESKAHLVVHNTQPAKALAQSDHWQPDLVILSAQAAGKLIEPLAGRSSRPAILLTGNLDEYHQVWKAWQKGGDEILMKPVFHSEELHQAIVTAMENAAAGSRKPRSRASA